MAIAQVTAGNRIVTSDLNAFYNLLKGVSGSGETITLIYNAAGSIIFQPSSDPVAGTQLVQIKNNAGTVKAALTSDGGGVWSARVHHAKGADIASGAALTPGTDGNYFHVTGTTTVTSIATAQAGSIVFLKFDGAVLLTHNGTSLILQGGVNYTTAAGDVFAFVSEGSGNWRELARQVAAAGANGRLVSRYIYSTSTNVTNTGAGTYVDFGGSFTTTVTTLAGDQVHVTVMGNANKQTSTWGKVVTDRSGTKLGNAYVYFANTGAADIPFMLDIWDVPGAGTFTYKPQAYNNDTAAINVGDNVPMQFCVEVWR